MLAPDTSPMVSTQVEPALAFGVQTQPLVLVAATKVVLAGTVSVIVTPVASWLPTFW